MRKNFKSAHVLKRMEIKRKEAPEKIGREGEENADSVHVTPCFFLFVRPVVRQRAPFLVYLFGACAASGGMTSPAFHPASSLRNPTRKKYSSRTIKNFGRLDLLLENDPNALEKLRLQAEQLNAERETAKQTAVQQRLTEAPRQMEIKDDTNADNIR